MNLLWSALAWIFDPANWVPGSQSPLPIQDRLIEHLSYTAIAIVIAALIALPLGFYIGHTGKGRQFVIAFTGSMRALPTLGLLFFLLMVFGYFLSYDQAPIVGATIAFVILAIPSMLGGAYSGLESVDRQTIDAARANGMTEMADPHPGRDPAGPAADHRRGSGRGPAGHRHRHHRLVRRIWAASAASSPAVSGSTTTI